MKEIILIRHGQSVWNKQGLFTGWEDVRLSEQGISEAVEAGALIEKHKIKFTLGFTSMLRRAIQTLWIALGECDQVNLPIIKNWHLNERHYGGLQGSNKEEMRKLHGKEQVHEWRRSFHTKPPETDKIVKAHPLYKGLEVNPRSESLGDTCDRVIPYWNEDIFPHVMNGEKVIVAAHGNSLRALIMHIEQISEDDIVKLEIPTGKPISIKFDDKGNFQERNFLE